MYLCPVTAEEITLIIRGLKDEATVGLDGIGARSLKACEKEFAGALLPRINQSLSDEELPATFKKTLMIPIYKDSGNRSDPNNYRPISIISNLVKIFEKLPYERIMKFLIQEGFYQSLNSASKRQPIRQQQFCML